MNLSIRPVRIDDAPAINEIRRMPGVMENILGIPSERTAVSERIFANMDANSHEFVAAVIQDGIEKVVGCAGLHISPSPRLRHSAGLGIMVHRDYQGKGVGTALMRAVLDLADNWLMLRRVELSVFTDNEKALALYKKMGFVIEGTKHMAVIRSGEYADEYIMARFLPEKGSR